jgi:hypothetical protein
VVSPPPLPPLIALLYFRRNRCRLLLCSNLEKLMFNLMVHLLLCPKIKDV